MEKEILKEIMKECKWFERIIVRFHRKLIMKIYHLTRFRIFNENN